MTLLNCGVEKTLERPLDFKEIQPVHPFNLNLKLMLKLKLQYFGHLMRTDSFEKTLMLERLKMEREGNGRG